MSWPMVFLGELVEILSGFAFKSEQFNSDGEGLPLVRIRDVKPRTSRTYYKGEFQEKFAVKDGDLLVGMDGEFNCAPWAGGRALLNQRVCRVSAKSGKIDQAYLNRFLPAVLKEIEDKTNFVTVKHLSGKQIADIKIPLPPLPEQRRIAGILDQADALRRLRRQSLSRLSDLGQAIFNEMFGDPATNPKRWETSKLHAVTSGKYGVKAGPFGSALKKEDYTTSGYRIYGQEQVIAGDFKVGNYYIDKLKFEKLKSCAVREGDILVSLVGSFGQILIVPSGIEPGIINPRLLKISPDTDVVTPIYLAALLKHSSLQRELTRHSYGGTMGILNAGILKEVSIPLAPLAMQNRFESMLRAASDGIGLLSRSNNLTDSLFASLQHRAFRGEL